ncbi:hypothetical protein FVE85_3471 [Porphyridium purpureum]|uniref:Pentatricopeptide repeat-containing protein n=1 Tax=Porphyridium purpureum TaxID=35688 RepID=A0A5J4YMZ4_PORPP|nr:hypothetical protein FVE85_3471 [Porphyridium purpureum]|eukprot:POR6095..scf249_10
MSSPTLCARDVALYRRLARVVLRRSLCERWTVALYDTGFDMESHPFPHAGRAVASAAHQKGTRKAICTGTSTPPQAGNADLKSADVNECGRRGGIGQSPKVQTQELNRKLQTALQGDAQMAGLDRMPERMFYQSGVRGPRASLVCGVRVLQRARAQSVLLDSHVIMHILELARPCGKINVVFAVVRLVCMQQHKNAFDLKGSARSGARIQVRAARERFSVIDAIAMDTLLRFFTLNKQNRLAAEVWKMMKARAFAAIPSRHISASILSQGAWISMVTENATEAGWIFRKLMELGVRPHARTLDLLTLTCARAGACEDACTLIRWTCRLGYSLNEKTLFAFIRAAQTTASGQALGELLIPFGYVLLEAERLCTTKRQRTLLMRAYFEALYYAASGEQLADEHVHDAADFAERVESWTTKDSELSSYCVYLFCQADRLDDALRVARDNHRRANGAGVRTDGKVPGQMHAFAYDAVILLSIQQNRLPEAMTLVIGRSVDSIMDARLAVFASKCYIDRLSRLEQLDLCAEVLDAFVQKFAAYLGEAGRSVEAILMFQKLQPPHDESTSSDSKEGQCTTRVSFTELVDFMEAYLATSDDGVRSKIEEDVATVLAELQGSSLLNRTND